MSSTIDNMTSLTFHLTQRRRDTGLLREANKKIQELENQHYAAITKISDLENEVDEQARSIEAVREERKEVERELRGRIRELETLRERMTPKCSGIKQMHLRGK